MPMSPERSALYQAPRDGPRERRDYEQFYKELGQKKQGFNEVLSLFAQNFIPETVALLTRKVALQLLHECVEGSPVDTGRFRSNWNLVRGREANLSVTDDILAPGDVESLGATATRDLRPYEAVSLSNNVEYAGALERGHSGQAPSGVLGLALDRLALQLSKANGRVR